MTDKKKGCGCGKKTQPPITPPPSNHNDLYYEQGRNGWTPDTTLQVDGGKVEVTVEPTKEQMSTPTHTYKPQNVKNLDTTIPPPPTAFAQKLLKVTNEMTNLLLRKNSAYGNTALNPTNVFSKLSAKEAICARLDDKLARISNKGINDKTEDTVDDLIGYLFLLKMAMNDEK